MIECHLPGASVGGMVFVFSIVDISVVVVDVVVVVEVTGFAFLHLSSSSIRVVYDRISHKNAVAVEQQKCSHK